MTEKDPPQPRRFIAGAVCPRCGVMDRIVVSGDGVTRACIDCGFADERPGDPPAPLSTRVSRASARRVETPSVVVRLIDPNDKSKS
jgi:uncharacterized metal-binding protein (TIGR02443 family)